MKFNIGNRFYLFTENTLFFTSFEVRTYKVNNVLICGHDLYKYQDNGTSWFDEKECLTKEEVIEKINTQIEKIKKRDW